MNKRCARCEKTVYPIEELKCLDKVWHKGCFKCQECGMTLSMKTYKGFNKLPYCEAHIPKAKATAVAETPEMKRLAENTKNQSNVQYHADFEKNKAKFTQVADDPETRRMQQNSKIISNVSYHGDLERKAWMERKRSDQDSSDDIKVPAAGASEGYDHHPEPSVHHHHIPPQQHQQGGGYHPTHPQQHQHPPSLSSSSSSSSKYRNNPAVAPPIHPGNNHPQSQQPTSQSYYQQHSNSSAGNPISYNQQHHQQHHPPNNQPAYYNHRQPTINPHPTHPQHQHQHQHQHPQHNVYQDKNHNSSYSARGSGNQTLVYSSQTGPVQQGPVGKVGSIADYDPVNDQYGSILQQKKTNQSYNSSAVAYHQQQANNYQGQRGNVYRDPNQQQHHHQHQHSHSMQQVQGGPMGRQSYGGMQPPQPQMQQKVNAPPTHLGRCFRAIYDYEAVDSDEVSFRDGDLLVNCASIDEGWMMGTVQRTGKVGMLPANYVERAA